MMILHDTLDCMNEATLTERGQISVPANLRRALGLRPGQTLRFEVISADEFRVYRPPAAAEGPLAALGYARRLRPKARSTEDWMSELRDGER